MRVRAIVVAPLSFLVRQSTWTSVTREVSSTQKEEAHQTLPTSSRFPTSSTRSNALWDSGEQRSLSDRLRRQESALQWRDGVRRHWREIERGGAYMRFYSIRIMIIFMITSGKSKLLNYAKLTWSTELCTNMHNSVGTSITHGVTVNCAWLCSITTE